ncbi:uncharacterized protein PG986_014747 [Apiospora aurea]|uniref:Uncharacterized protein n=1 Tax=Apiospora aurea TaxID=335848 RepID=A0ABR1PTV2_9PEZI
MRTRYGEDEDDEELNDLEFDHEEVAWSARWKEMELDVLVLSSVVPDNSGSETGNDNQETHEEENDELGDVHYKCLITTVPDA